MTAKASKGARAEGLPSPDGYGVVIWADLSKSNSLAKAAQKDPAAALKVARHALTFRNPAVRRNAVRMLRAIGKQRAPLKPGDAVLEALAVASGGGRPHVMFEAIAASRVLQGLPEVDLKARYPGVPPFGEPQSGPDTKTALGIRWRWEFRDYKAPKPTENQEEAQELHRALWGPPHSISGVGGPVLPEPMMAQRPRGEVLDEIKADLSGPRAKLAAAALRRLWFLEDPLAAPWVRKAATHTDDKVRRHALQALGYIGDEDALPLLAERFRAGGHDSKHACSGLSLLGDTRCFNELWRFTGPGKFPAVTPIGFKMFDELNVAMSYQLAAAPEIVSKNGAFAILKEVRDPAAMDILIDATGACKSDADARRLLARLTITPERVATRQRWNKILTTGGITYESMNADWYTNLGPAPGVSVEDYHDAYEWGALAMQMEDGDQVYLTSFLERWTEALRRQARKVIAAKDAPASRRAAARRTLEIVEGGAGVPPDEIPTPKKMVAVQEKPPPSGRAGGASP